LHPETKEELKKFLDVKVGNEEADQSLTYNIHLVDVEHYSINSENIFMIVKSVEEASTDNFKVI
jgi:hypothetical protein